MFPGQYFKKHHEGTKKTVERITVGCRMVFFEQVMGNYRDAIPTKKRRKQVTNLQGIKKHYTQNNSTTDGYKMKQFSIFVFMANKEVMFVKFVK